MLDKRLLKTFNSDDCTQYRTERENWLKLTKERLKRLRAKQSKNPEWKSYDQYANDFVGIDIRIEEQEAVLEELLQEIELINAKAQELGKELKEEIRRTENFQIPMELKM